MPQPHDDPTYSCSRRAALRQCVAGLVAATTVNTSTKTATTAVAAPATTEARPWVTIRGIYGGFPEAILDRRATPADFGVNAIWVSSDGLKHKEIERYHQMGLKVFAEYNSMHAAQYLKEHPDAAPIGVDGKPSPPPHGWQGVSPHHAGYRRNRMDEFRRVLKTFEIDGIWLDYHHSHASWERAEPAMPDTDFSPTALRSFTDTTGIALPTEVPKAAEQLLGTHRNAWTKFRCDAFTDWVREYREVLNDVRSQAMLGTFHCPWSPTDFDGAIRHKLAIDLLAQAKYLDIFSIMPYHSRFGHPQDPAWIARQTQRLGELLNLKGTPDEKQKIWPIVQLADWGEAVPVGQVEQVLNFGTQRPATGVMVFHWSGVSQQWDKVEAVGRVYRAMRPSAS